LIAIQKINADEETPVFGIVTDAERWQFGKLQRSLFTRHVAGFTIDNLPELFGTLHFIFQSISANIK
ncbi:MAG: hypothetical protein M3T96_02215, partial [Acidobacteriota bacterium]|nr:hypothetical protein [Acidobacteriota bacterium]